MKVFCAISIVSLGLCAGLYAADMTGEEILEKIDHNMTSENRVAVSSMEIHGQRVSRTLRAKSWIKGSEKSFTEYLYPPREAGTKMLKSGEELWIYSPSSNRIIKIAGHMLRQAVMGSDISYEDFMEDPVLKNIYFAQRLEDEMYKDYDCYVVELTARKEDTAYYRRRLWVDKKMYLPMREERYAKSGILLKEFTIEEVIKIGGRWYPGKMTFKDALSNGRGTILTIESVEFNVNIKEYIFTKAALRK